MIGRSPDHAAIGKNDFGVNPVGLIATDPVAAIAHPQVKLRHAAEINADRHRRHALAQHRRFESLFRATHGNGEDHGASAAARLLVGVDAHAGGELLPRPRQLHQHVARGMREETAAVFAPAQRERPVHPAVSPDHVEMRKQRKAAQRLGCGGVTIKLRVHPIPHLRHL
jgi:hypothetical protein